MTESERRIKPRFSYVALWDFLVSRSRLEGEQQPNLAASNAGLLGVLIDKFENETVN